MLLGAALSFTLGKDGVARGRAQPAASRFPTSVGALEGGRWGFLESLARVKSQSREAGERSVPRTCVDASGESPGQVALVIQGGVVLPRRVRTRSPWAPWGTALPASGAQRGGRDASGKSTLKRSLVI